VDPSFPDGASPEGTTATGRVRGAANTNQRTHTRIDARTHPLRRTRGDAANVTLPREARKLQTHTQDRTGTCLHLVCWCKASTGFEEGLGVEAMRRGVGWEVRACGCASNDAVLFAL